MKVLHGIIFKLFTTFSESAFPSTLLTFCSHTKYGSCPKYSIFFTHSCHCTDYSFPSTSLDNPYPSFMHIEENPLLLLYCILPERRKMSTSLWQTPFRWHCTNPHQSWLSQNEKGQWQLTWLWWASSPLGLFVFSFSEWRYLSQKRHFWCPSKQKHLSFLSLPSLSTHFLIKRKFCTTWLNFLRANPNSENPRKKGEWVNKWHLGNKPDLDSLGETQLKCCLFCEAFSTFPAMQLPCPSRPQGTLVIAHGVTTMFCVTMPSAELWAQLDPLGFFQFCIYSKQKRVEHIDTEKRHPSNYQKSKHRAL